MIWDKVSGFYDRFELIVNGKVYRELGLRTSEYVSENDAVLECACGTGAITRKVAQKCRCIVATDFSPAMLRRAEKNCRGLSNVTFKRTDITNIKAHDESFDKVIAGNIIHLLDDPCKAVSELLRVCKTGGKVIIPTYINNSENTDKLLVALLEKIGVRFTKEFSFDSYKQFFADMSLTNTEFFVIDGRMPCAVAVITK